MTFTATIGDQRMATCAGAAFCPQVPKNSPPTDEFIATLAHELRTPLCAILNSLRIMDRCGANEPMARQAHEIIERQTRHMVQVIDDVLDISRGTHGKLALRKERVNLAAVVANAVAAAEPLITAHGHELMVVLPSELPVLAADSSRLEQVLVNLLTNAAKYTNSGGRIWLTVESAAEAVVLRVRDTGIGIAPEMLSHVFELFVQVGRTCRRSLGGLGIGLALVRQLVEMHGGSVSAFSAGLGRGSEFVVRLPMSSGTQTRAKVSR